MIKRILAGVCSPELTATLAEHVVQLAQLHGADVTAMAVSDMAALKHVHPEPLGAQSLVQEIVQEKLDLNDEAVTTSMKLLRERLERASIECRMLRSGGDPIAALVSASRYHDLLVTGLTGLLEHGVAEERRDVLVRLIEEGVHPILAIPSRPVEVKRILIAYSGSPESARTMRQFAAYRMWPEAALKVVHFGSSKDQSQLLLFEARSYLEHCGFNVETELIHGSPVGGLQEVATAWQANLLVIGNSAKSMLRRRVLGDTAITALRDSELPVFLSQ